MADPVFVNCAKNAWTKVATNVTAGLVWKANTSPIYFHTYRDTGNPAPTAIGEGVEMQDNIIPISASAGIDAYIYCKNDAGRVRVDL